MDKKSPFGLKPGQLSRLLAIAKEDDAAGKAESSESRAGEGKGSEARPTWIGQYKVLDVLGEGGMGTVYLARQEYPIERTVAVKLIKPGMDSRQMVARFEAERQALALLDHPNIAHALDAGTTEQGRPFFVMEYVQGLSITEYCDRQKLTIDERLSLFLQVCLAIQYAHRRGIIHRDIKPSNILVFVRDGKAVPKVIDFGMAKAFAQPLSEQTLYTRDGRLIGTPEYASPEQMGLRDKVIDARSDVYSLGVVLYVLLTGTLPFDSQTFRDGGIEHIRRTIREEEAKKPSTRLIGLGKKAESVAESRQTSVASLRKTLHRELEWIPLKALRKEPEDRYSSVDELAKDIDRYLNGIPLAAGRPTLAYGARKFVRRNRIQIMGVVAVAVALLAGAYLERVRLTVTLDRRDDAASLGLLSSQPVNDSQTRVFGANSGLIGHWSLDESSGEVAVDSTGVHHGFLEGNPAWVPDGGKIGGALEFDGVDDHVIIEHVTGVASMQRFTIAFWVMLKSLPRGRIQQFIALTEQRVVVRHDGIDAPDRRQLHFLIRTSDGTFRHMRVNDVLKEGVFQHVAATYDGAIMRLYLDGRLLSSLNEDVVLMLAPIDRVDFSAGPAEAFRGLLDDVWIYDRALSEEEIKTLVGSAGPAGAGKPYS